MGWLDTVFRGASHEIFGFTAMQHQQFNFAGWGTKLLVAAFASLAANPVVAGPITHAGTADPLLNGGPASPCAERADYVAGVDVGGNPVVPADAGAAPIPVPDAVAVPFGRQHGGRGGEPYAVLDGHKLAPLVNPPPCPAPRHR
jgi:hypothetical protein